MSSARGDGVGHDLDENRLRDLQVVLSPVKLRIMQQILASSTGALSMPEFAVRNEITESTIRDHVRDLCDREQQIVTMLEPDVSPVPNGYPRKYAAVTSYGVELLKQVGQYEQVGVLYDMYEAAELSFPESRASSVSLEEIESFEHRPEPEWL